MYKVVIVDDEQDAIESIKLIIQEHFSDIVISGTANSANEAIKLIPTVEPDIVFLDIEMPGGTGFDVLEGLPNRNFNVIFVTAYNQYAIKAFKYSALDYILKPIDIDELVTAVSKIHRSNTNQKVEDKINLLLDNVKNSKPDKIALSTSESIEFVNISDIVQILAEGSYSTLKFLDQTELVVSKNLGEFESLLEDHPFYRPHQSHLINLLHVKKINRLGNEIIMDDGSVAFLSRRKKNQFLEIMSTMVQHKK
ncbi:MAG: LytTR family DNA-binding domain-containing protein [Salinivirgaceae bacterium]